MTGRTCEKSQPMKTSLRIVLAATALVMFSEATLARVFVRGVPSCREWTAAREKHKRETPGQIPGERTWLLGFLSGLAIGQDKEFWGDTSPRALDNEAAYQWVDNYCRANPSKDLDDAGAALFVERTRNR